MDTSQLKNTDDKIPTVSGFVGLYHVTALGDTGCCSVVVKKQFVEKNQHTRKRGCLLMADKIERKVPNDLLIGVIQGAREPNNSETSWNMMTWTLKAEEKKTEEI